MAFQARRFDEALRQHVEIPIVLRFPVVFRLPTFQRLRVVWRMSGKSEAGAARLAAVAAGATELLLRMFAIGTDKKVQARMGTEFSDARLRQILVGNDVQLEFAGIGEAAALIDAGQRFLA